MGYEIVGNNGKTLYFSFGGWETLLAHAIRNGWEPMGAVRDPDLYEQFSHPETGDQRGDDLENDQMQIIASYRGNDWQCVYDEDARNLAVALISYREKLLRLRSILSIPAETIQKMQNANLDLPFGDDVESFSMVPVYTEAKTRLITEGTPEELLRYEGISDSDLDKLIRLAYSSQIDFVSETISMCESGGFIIC